MFDSCEIRIHPTGSAIARRTSFLLEDLGAQLFSSGITVRDDPLRIRGLRSRSFDGEGLLAITDIKNHILWAYDIGQHRLRLLAGAPGQQGLGDGEPSLARFWLPTSITLADDRSGFIVTEAGHRQRRHVTRDGRVRTLPR